MRILLLTSSFHRGGAETHILALANQLVHLGHRVTLISSGGEMVQKLNSEVIHLSLPLNSRNPFSLFKAYLDLKKHLTQSSYDVIHAHARLPAYLAHRLAKKSRLPFITTVHAHFKTGIFFRRLSKWGIRSIAVSEDLKQYLCDEYGLFSQHIRVIPNGIDCRIFSPCQTALSNPPLYSLNIPSGGCFHLVFLSRLDHDCSRGAFFLLKLAPRLKKVCSGLKITIGGGGNAFGELSLMAENINHEMGEAFIFMSGYLSDPLSLLRCADGLIGVSRAALEAMACGVPVILAGDEGFLGLADEAILPLAALSNFCCRSSVAIREENLYSAIERLLSLSNEDRQALGERLRRYVCDNHSIEKTVLSTVALYQDALRTCPSDRGDTVLCGYYGYGNCGDDALLHASIERCRRQYPHQTVSALTRGGKKDEEIFGVRCISRFSFFALRKELRGAKRLVFGGGTLLQDATSVRSLFYYTSLLLYAQKRGVSCELWGNGLCPPHSFSGRRKMISALLGCDRIGLRDHSSLSLAMELLPKEKHPYVYFENDLAFPTPPSERSRSTFLLRRYGLISEENGHTVRFAVAILRGNAGRGYQKIMAAWLAMLKAEGIKLVFIPMLPREDEKISRRVCQELGGVFACGLSPSDIVGLMSHSCIVCAMRLHGLIFAASAEVPFVGFGGDIKIETFCREHGGLYFTDLYH